MTENYFIEEENTLYITVKGNANIDHLLKMIDFLCEIRQVSQEIKVLENASSAMLSLSYSEVRFVAETIKAKLGKLNSIKHAVIHTDPLSTAYALIASDLTKSDNYDLKVFSTVEAAKAWLER